MRLGDLLDALGVEYDVDCEAIGLVVELHQQPNYPLKGQVANVRILDGKIAIASGPANQYGSQEAWEEDL